MAETVETNSKKKPEKASSGSADFYCINSGYHCRSVNAETL